MNTTTEWEKVLSHLNYAFQPIVSIHTGACIGYEALLRGHREAGFDSIFELIDTAHRELWLVHLDMALRERAISAFLHIKGFRRTRLFFNVDSRVLEMPDYEPGRTRKILNQYGLRPSQMCFEVSERHDAGSSSAACEILRNYREQLYAIAIDDYGAGFAGLQLLYNSEPHFLKIDRFFVEGIDRNPRKKLVVANIVQLAHLLNVQVVAEGVETDAELRACRESGCDLAQGYFIERPTTETSALLSAYPSIADSRETERRHIGTPVGASALIHPPTVCTEATMEEVLHAFRANSHATFIVVIDGSGTPFGIIRERSIKHFIYSQYGYALLAGGNMSLSDYVTRCPVSDLHAPLEHILELFSLDHDAEEGVILTNNGHLVGFLRASELVREVSERSLASAREQNPLTQLPGNNAIATFIDGALADPTRHYALVYFDFDNFKPFNDTYGFRRGDRAIQLFGDILRRAVRDEGVFVGHVGGDDFFVGLELSTLRTRRQSDSLVRRLTTQFERDVQSLYDATDRARGGIVAEDRHGTERIFPMLTISAAVVYVDGDRSDLTADALGLIIARVKKQAKVAPSRFAAINAAGTFSTVPCAG